MLKSVSLAEHLLTFCLPWAESTVERVEEESTLVDRSGELAARHLLLGAVVFSNARHYTIRVEADRAPKPNQLDIVIERPGAFIELLSDTRYLRGLVQLQDLVDRALIERRGGKD